MTDSPSLAVRPPPRPQSLLLSFFALHVLDTGTRVSSASVISVLERIGVSEGATRSTLARMVKRDLLASHRRGRQAFLGLTDRAASVLADGRRRIHETGPVNHDGDGHWTVVAFSFPEDRGSDRHDLRSRLTWAGFGLLQNGLWIAPGTVPIDDVVTDLDVRGRLTVLHAEPMVPTAAADLVHVAFDTEAIAVRYREFLSAWEPSNARCCAPDDLTRRLLLHTDWLSLVRRDPRLPVEHLPPDWPAITAEQAFRRLDRELTPGAQRLADTELDRMSPENAPEQYSRIT